MENLGYNIKYHHNNSLSMTAISITRHMLREESFEAIKNISGNLYKQETNNQQIKNKKLS